MKKIIFIFMILAVILFIDSLMTLRSGLFPLHIIIISKIPFLVSIILMIIFYVVSTKTKLTFFNIKTNAIFFICFFIFVSYFSNHFVEILDYNKSNSINIALLKDYISDLTAISFGWGIIFGKFGMSKGMKSEAEGTSSAPG